MAKIQLRYAVIINGKVDEIILGSLAGKTRQYDRIEDVTDRPDIVVGTTYPFTLYSEYLKTLASTVQTNAPMIPDKKGGV